MLLNCLKKIECFGVHTQLNRGVPFYLIISETTIKNTRMSQKFKTAVANN